MGPQMQTSFFFWHNTHITFTKTNIFTLVFAIPTCGQLKSLIVTIIFQLKSTLLNPICFKSIILNLNIYNFLK
jgi:hypothetical protein